MTEFKKGDRVKVTLEGVVSGASDTGDDYVVVQDANGQYLGDAYQRRDGVTVEKLPDPLPTEPYSVIKKDGRVGAWFYTLTTDGRWRSGRSGVLLDPDDFGGDTFEVVYDAGVDK